MDQHTQLQHIVKHVWTDQCELLDDDELLLTIATTGDAETLIERVEGGADFDWSGTIHILHEAFKFTAELLALYAAIREIANAEEKRRQLAAAAERLASKYQLAADAESRTRAVEVVVASDLK